VPACVELKKKTKRKIALFKKDKKNKRSQQMEWRRVS
jgi:hypothetical protein